MAIENHPVWPFGPNWSSEVTENLQWLTSVLASPTGAEQRRALRLYPRREFEFTTIASGRERSFLDQLMMTHGARDWYLPLWHETHALSDDAVAASDFIPCTTVVLGELREGEIVVIFGETAFDYELAEIETITNFGITTAGNLVKTWPKDSYLFPVREARLTDQPSLTKITDAIQTLQVRFKVTQQNNDVLATIAADSDGPLVMNGLIVNSYQDESGHDAYFHTNSGTAEGQFLFIYGALLAHEALAGGTVAERTASDYYLKLAQEMLDAIGTNSYVGPILRQPVPTDLDTITLMQRLFASRSDVPEQAIVYGLEVPVTGGDKLVIPYNENGSKTHRVWQIFPVTSELLFQSPYSPAFDIISPGAETQIEIPDANWTRSGDETVITIPAGSPVHASWMVVYGYSKATSIPMGEGYEALPSWSKIAPAYVASAPDTFRFFEQAMNRAIALDDRPASVTAWTRLRNAMRRSAIRGQDITDLREAIKPLPGFPAIPASGEPGGMFCQSDHPLALPPIRPGLDQNWTGYDFWSRDANGDIVANVPDSGSTLARVQIGRAFPDDWRTATAYQDADEFLYVAVSATRKPVLANKEYFLIFLSSTIEFGDTTTWYADIGSLAEFVVTTDDVIEFFIPRTEFRLRSFAGDGSSVWGTAIPAGTHIQTFGISSEMTDEYEIRLRAMRLVADDTAEAVRGAKIPFFPGAMPFTISADTERQQFLGGNGSPLHGYQLADYWWWLETEADLIHPDLVAGDLPIPNRTTGALEYPINPLTAGGVSKPVNALLMEQQLTFLQHAQLQWDDDGGSLGPFAHTFVLNTPARSAIGWPTPHTWVYTNENPDTASVAYQVRIVESLSLLVDLVKADPRFEDAHDLAEELASNWLSWLNTAWPNLTGSPYQGMPTVFRDPAIGLPQTLGEDPQSAAMVLRACLWLEKAGAGTSATNQALMLRCWQYLESMWRTTGEMAFTWSPDPIAKTWYGPWHGEIMSTLSAMVSNSADVPAGIDIAVVRNRLVQTRTFLERFGVKFTNSGTVSFLTDIYRGYSVLTDAPEHREELTVTYERLLEEADNQTAIPLQRDTAGIAFPKQGYVWTIIGRLEHRSLRSLFYSLRGRASSVWVPTFYSDMTAVQDTPAGDSYIVVANINFGALGGPREGRRDIMIELLDGTRIYRRIVSNTVDLDGNEIIGVDTQFYNGLTASTVLRISFMTICRLDQDQIDIVHRTDSVGVSTCAVTFKTVPDLRIAGSGF